MRKTMVAVLASATVLLAFVLGAGVALAETNDWISVGDWGDYPDGNSTDSDIRADGNLVAFQSEVEADDFYGGWQDDTNGVADVFVHDRVFLGTELVSVNSDGDGAGNGESTAPSISPDGQYVAFQSSADDLVESDIGGFVDIFVRDLLAQTTVLVSRSSSGDQGSGDSTDPSITTDGERVFVAYESVADNLVASDSNGVVKDVFISYFYKIDPSTIVTELVSRRDNETQGNRLSEDPSLSGDGTYVAYASKSKLDSNDSENKRDIYVTDWDKDGTAGSRDMTTKMVSVQTGGTEVTDYRCDRPSISADGKYVVYDSESQELTGDADTVTDVFRTDWQTPGTVTEKVSLHSDGASAAGRSEYADINADGRYVTFESGSSDLVTGDSNGYRDVFVRDMVDGVTYLVSTDFFGGQADERSGKHNDSRGPSITAALGDIAPEVSFFSQATNLVWGYEEDPDAGYRDVFVATTDTTPRIDQVIPIMGPEEGGVLVGIIGANFLDDWLWTGSWFMPENTDPVIYFGDVPVVDWQWVGPKVLIATLPAHEIGTVQVKVVAGGGETADTPADDFAYVPSLLAMQVQPPRVAVRHEQDDVQIVYTGDWSEGDNQGLSMEANTYSVDAEATITISFTGTQLDWIASLGPTMGKALVSVDGGEAIFVDLYSETEVFQQVVWSTGLLAYGEHTVTITFPEGADYVEGMGINLDAVEVYGAVLEPVEVLVPNMELWEYLEEVYAEYYL